MMQSLLLQLQLQLELALQSLLDRLRRQPSEVFAQRLSEAC